MPKKQQTKKMSEDELSDLLQKSLKKTAESESEHLTKESETPETNLDLQTLEFHQFMRQGMDSGTPVLERIAGSQTPRPIFVGGIPRGVSEDEGNGKDVYVPGRESNNEPKYTESSAQIYMESQSADLTRIGKTRDTISQANREASFQQVPELRQWGSESPTRERTWAAERIDVARAGRRDPFEKDEVKYEKYRPKFPK